MSAIDRAEAAKLLDDRIKPLEMRMEKFLDSQEERQRVMESVLSRLTTVISGDKEFGTIGLRARVDAHDEFVESAERNQAETNGMIKSTLFFGGAVITIVNVVIQLIALYAK